MKIKFGTSGWRGLIADDFTFPNVRIVVQAIADHLRHENLHNRSVVVGYDTRFLSEQFAQTAAAVLAGNGIEALVCDRDTPTPVVAFEILRRRAAAGINITASHNPYDYSGLKLNASWGGPALPEVTEKIESLCEPYLAGDGHAKVAKEGSEVRKRLIAPIDPRPHYFKHIERLVDTAAIKKGRVKVAVDVLWGTGRGYLDEFLRRCGAEVTVLHAERDVLYNGGGPSPEPEHLTDLHKALVKAKAHLGLATDGDADRFGVMDVDGSLLPPNDFLPLLLDHLVKTRGWKGVVARSVMTSHFLDAVAKRHGLELRETPVGFKYIGDVMMQENSVYPSRGGNFLMGGEESGGLSISGHVPEKDGVLACLLAAEIVAVNRKPLRATLQALQKEVGSFHSRRLNFLLPRDKMIELRDRLRQKPPTRFTGFTVRRIVETDGHKFILTDGSWIGVRLSGTEPVVRVYLETGDASKLRALEKAGRELAGVR
jgi:alpha-D-glucose phosphate-specific phosphoglucomutase